MLSKRYVYLREKIASIGLPTSFPPVLLLDDYGGTLITPRERDLLAMNTPRKEEKEWTIL